MLDSIGDDVQLREANPLENECFASTNHYLHSLKAFLPEKRHSSGGLLILNILMKR